MESKVIAVTFAYFHGTGGAYLEVMQQIMAAAQSAAQLEVEELIRDRASDGSLPSPALANGTPGDNPAAAVAAAAGSGLLKRKATDAEQDSSDTAEASAMPKAKRQKADDSLMTQMTEAEEGQGGTRADLARGPSAGHRLNDSSAAGTASEVEAFNAEEPGVTGGAAAAPCAGTETGAGGRTGTQAWHDQALPDHEIDHPGELETAPPRAGANAVSKPSQSGPSTAPPHQDTSLGPDQAGPSSAMPDQGAATGPGQPGPSTAVPDQATEGDVNPETKEKKEQARNRTRAWRKVLLDGLDLQAELTAAAASAGQADSDVAQAEAQVSHAFLFARHLMCSFMYVLHCRKRTELLGTSGHARPFRSAQMQSLVLAVLFKPNSKSNILLSCTMMRSSGSQRFLLRYIASSRGGPGQCLVKNKKRNEKKISDVDAF